MDKMSRAMKGDSNTQNKKATKVDKHLAKMLANHPKLRYTSAQLEEVKMAMEKSG